MEPQLHFNVERPTPEKVLPIENGAWQPSGGLWTLTPDFDSESFAFWAALFANMDRLSHVNPRWHRMIGRRVCGWMLHPEESARVAVIDGPGDLLALGEKYGWQEGYWQHPRAMSAPVHVCTLNFSAVAEDVDAIRVTDSALFRLEAKEAGKHRLAFWHAESTCWFRWCFERVEEVGPASGYMRHKHGDVFTILNRVMRSYKAAGA
jgi:hypothetical protein